MNNFDIFQFSQVQKRKRVLLRGPVLTQSGYGVHARQIAKWLLSKSDVELEIQALPWGDTPWLINKDQDEGFIGEIMQRTVDPTGRTYDVSVQLQLPNEWDSSLAKENIGVTAGVETDACNPEWLSSCNKMSMVIVPSNHSKNSLIASGKLNVPISVIPEAYCDQIRTSNDELNLNLTTSFNFLLFGQLTGNNPENERKNIFYTVKWICETFKDDKDVGIIIKTNSGRNTQIDKRIIIQTFKNLAKEIRKSEYPKIYILHGDMEDEEVSSLYKNEKIKALVSLTKGEGFGLPILEAAASGLPVIATKWSGHTDFLNLGKYIEIDYSLQEIHSTRIDGKIFLKGQKWAIPSEEDFKRKIRKFKSSSSIPKEWAKELQIKILENYSIEKIINQYNEITKGFFE